MEINVINEYGNINFDYEDIINKVNQAFSSKFNIDKSATIILVNIDEIHRINKEYRNIDRPTDVISFEEEKYDYSDESYLGEIFICIDKVYMQAKEYEHSEIREFAFLLCHGLLHINGYDHLNEKDEKIMFSLQDEILNKAGYVR